MTSPSSQKTIEVVAAIIKKNGEFLITKRFEKSHLGHCWEFPGGKIESGETIEECIIRECREELEVEVQPIRKIRELKHSYPELTVHLHFMICELKSGNPKPIGCSDLKWVKPIDLKNFEFPAADREIIEELEKKEI